MNILALIPARAGSKGIPNKSLALFMGEKLINHTLRLARQCYIEGMVSDVCLTTDMEDLLADALLNNITWLRRPPEMATDSAPVIDAVRHALELFTGFDAVLLLQPTNPLRNLDDIRGAIALLEAHPEADSVISHIPARCHPARMRHAGGQKYAWKLPTSEETQGTPRQQLPPILQRTGEIYLTRTKQIMEGQDMEGTFCVPWMQDPARAWDIDEPVDLVIAEALWRAANATV